MRTIKYKFLLAIFSFFVTSYSYGGQFNNCTVVQIVSNGDKNVHVQLSCAMPNPPPCATASVFIGFDGSSIAGKRYFAMASMAFAMNMKLNGNFDDSVCSPYQSNVVWLTDLRVTQ
jgi:hypothetical protein